MPIVSAVPSGSPLTVPPLRMLPRSSRPAACGLAIEVLNRRSYLREASALADERSAPNTAAVFLLTAMIVGVGCVAFYLVVVA